MSNAINNLEDLASAVKKYAPNLSFTIFEIGARYVEGRADSFYQLLDLFPKSRLVGFEADAEHCVVLNENAAENCEYYPTAIGGSNGEATFYEAVGAECGSLYKQNKTLIDKFNALSEVMEFKSEQKINVSTLDHFMEDKNFDSIDFIKMDVQGAELDVFKGGLLSLNELVFIVAEVQFVPLYEDVPLFGDLCKHLIERDYIFHKFIGMAGRTLKPITLRNDPFSGTQQLWADAIFITDYSKLETLAPDKLLKLGISAFIYQSPDITFHCFKLYDDMQGTSLHKDLLGTNS